MEDNELKRLREEIDRVDGEILRLFTERMRLVGQIGVLKSEQGLPLRDQMREAEILVRARERAGKEFGAAAEALFDCLLRLSCTYQEHLRGDADT